MPLKKKKKKIHNLLFTKLALTQRFNPAASPKTAASLTVMHVVVVVGPWWSKVCSGHCVSCDPPSQQLWLTFVVRRGAEGLGADPD